MQYSIIRNCSLFVKNFQTIIRCSNIKNFRTISNPSLLQGPYDFMEMTFQTNKFKKIVRVRSAPPHNSGAAVIP